MRVGHQSRLLVVCCYYLATFYLTVSGEPCKYESSNPCNCKANGIDYNFKEFMDARGGLDLNITGENNDYTYFIQPCNRKMTMPNMCGTASVACQVYNKASNLAYSLGDVNKYSVNGTSKDFVMTNSDFGPDGNERTMHLIVNCTNKTDKFTYKGVSGNPPLIYTFTLETKHVCANGGGDGGGSGGISPGTVMVIIFFVMLVLYLVGGVLFLKLGKKAQGKELVPNYEFWTGFPSLLKDGVIFTTRCCRGGAVYGKI